MQSQKTIKNEASLEGIGLQTGKPCKVKFLPSGPDTGINFIRVDLPGKPLISVREFLEKELSATGPRRRSAISVKGVGVETVEHLMAALWALSIDNIRIEVDNAELPGLDGSAAVFFNALKETGEVLQEAPKRILEIKEVLWCEEKDSFLGIFPCHAFKVSYVLDYPQGSIERQCASFELDEKVFEEKIARARTFCLREEAEALLGMGFGKGANFKNTLVMDKGEPMENELRFPDECARHKILDLIGDLYILGSPLKGRVIGIRSGHRLNLELVRKIKEKYL